MSTWRDALAPFCVRPQDFPAQVLRYNEHFVCIKDGYPKSLHHFLVMPRSMAPRLNALSRKDIVMLDSMKSEALEVITSITGSRFEFGFHAVPSLKPLHLHVISQDFTGTGLKKKSHYNSFTTPFFVKIEEAISMLRDLGEINLDKDKYETYLKRPLQCLHCSAILPNMPKLKLHLSLECRSLDKV